MEQQVTDSIFAAVEAGAPDTVHQTEFLVSGIIPYAEKPGTALFEIMPAARQRELYGYTNRDPGQPIPAGLLNTDFSFGMLTASLVLLTVLSVFARKTVIAAFLSPGIKRQRETHSPSSSVIITWPPLAMNLFTFFNVSLFTAIAAVHTGILSPMPGGEMIKTTALVFVVFAGMLLLRHLACIAVASVSGQKKLFMEYVSVVYSTWFITAVCYFALSSVILFVPFKAPATAIYVGAVLTAFLLFFRTIRLLNIFIIWRVPILYFILYLCALEVLPVLIVLKFLNVL